MILLQQKTDSRETLANLVWASWANTRYQLADRMPLCASRRWDIFSKYHSLETVTLSPSIAVLAAPAFVVVKQ